MGTRLNATIAGIALLGLLGVVPQVAAGADDAGGSGGSVTVTALVDRSAPGHEVAPTLERYAAANPSAARALVRRLQARDEVVSAAVDHRAVMADGGSATAAAVGPDPLRSQQWGLDSVHANAAWASSTGTGQVVALLDTGVDDTHPDLAGQVLPGADFTASSDGTGGDGTNDNNGHGTHVAGIVAAVANNAVGGAGLAPGVKILPVKVLDSDGSGWVSAISDGVLWAAANGATVINLSLGSTSDDPNLAAAIAYAHDVKGIDVVAAAGNDGTGANKPNYPAADPDVIAVGAITSTGAHATFSNTGSYVDLAAPGQNVLSTWPTTLTSPTPGYMVESGTSMATPFVAAAAALVRSRYAAADPDAVQARLEATAVDLGAAGRDVQFGNGEIDAAAAVCPATLAMTAPGVPGTLSATASSGSAQVVSSAPSCLGGSRSVTYTATATPTPAGGPVRQATSTTPTVTVGGLAGSTTYSIVVAATNGGGTSAATAPVTVTTTGATVPVAPAAPVAVAGDTTATVTWTPPISDGGSPLTGYRLTTVPGGAFVDLPASTTSTTLSGLVNGTTYRFTVTAVNALGSGAASATSNAISPGPAASSTTTTTTAPPSTTTTVLPTTTTSPTPTTGPTVAPPIIKVPGVAQSPSSTPAGHSTDGGYWVAGSDGSVSTFGTAALSGSNGAISLNQPVVGVASTPSGRGYWLVARDGGIFSFGDGTFFGSTGSMRLNQPIVGMTATPTGRGYWFVAADGGIFAFGDAGFFGSTGSMRLNQPIVGMTATPTGRGYWLVARDGGIFAFGDAGFFGSTGSIRLNQPIVGMTATASGRGYWFVAADGGIFSYGDAAFFGSTGSTKLAAPIIGMATSGSGGYWLAGADGRVFPFGTAAALGSPSPASRTYVGVAS